MGGDAGAGARFGLDDLAAPAAGGGGCRDEELIRRERGIVGAELRDAQTRSIELTERKVAAEDTLKHIDIRSPQDGVVHQLAVHTIGGVIGASIAASLLIPPRRQPGLAT